MTLRRRLRRRARKTIVEKRPLLLDVSPEMAAVAAFRPVGVLPTGGV
jgi:hypothetical protein